MKKKNLLIGGGLLALGLLFYVYNRNKRNSYVAPAPPVRPVDLGDGRIMMPDGKVLTQERLVQNPFEVQLGLDAPKGK